MIASSAKLFVLASFLAFCLAASGDVCPLDYVSFQVADGSETENSRRLRNRALQEKGGVPPIEIVSQRGDYVDFIVRNSTAFQGFIPDHLFVEHSEGEFNTQRCV